MAIKNLFPAIRPSLSIDFTKGFVDPRITFTRATTGVATRINPFGLLEVVPSGVPRLDYDPVTRACKGLLIEEQRANSIRNNTMQGVAAGAPGSAPTNWAPINPSNGLYRNIIGSGVEFGINYVDIQYSGTATANGLTAVYFENANYVSASKDQTWTNSVFVSMVGGTLNNILGVVVGLDENNSAANLVTGSNTPISLSAGPLISNRKSHTRTLSDALTAFVRPYIFFNYTSGAVIDITLRIGMPQLESGAFATSVIPTSGSQVTRAADVATMIGANFSSWYRQDEGTILVEASIPFTATDNRGPIRLDDGTENNRIMLRNNGSGSRLVAQVITAGSVSADIGSIATAISANTNFKSAVSYKADSFAMSFNGISTLTDEAGAVPTVSRLLLGDAQSSNSIKGSTIKRIAFYPAALPTYVQALTS